MPGAIENATERLPSMFHEQCARAYDGRSSARWCDFEICDGTEELFRIFHHINRYGYELVTVTQCGDMYTVFFRRHICG